MDKRLFLALLLTAFVVVLTPVIFPPPRPSSPVSDTTAASSRAAAGRAEVTPDVRTQPGQSTPGGRAAEPVTGAQRRVAADTARAVAPVVAETTVVGAGGSTYRFINPGAAPVSVVLDDYRSLRPGGRGSVDLVRSGDQLLRYRFVIGADTIALDTIPMRASVASSTGGASAVTFTSGPLALTTPGVTPTATLTYTIPAGGDAHLTVVEGRVAGVPPGRAALLVDLPRTLRTEEADTLEDIRHLSYAFKRGNEEVQSTSFGKLDTGTVRAEGGPLAWVAARNKYFLTALIGVGNESPFAGVLLAGVPHPQRALPREGRATVVVPLRDGTFRFQVYAGPQKYTRLHALGRDLENVNPYGGWMHGFVQPFSTIVMRILLWLKRTTA
ncbi:MAG: YidC/Oxa1 family insertase periplasmic-domain containing protein, partial [Gemmatimonadaceae bacterium]